MLQRGNDHLTLGIELVVTDLNGSAIGEGYTAHAGLVQIDSAVLGKIITIADEIQITVVCNQLVSLQLSTVLIEIVSDHTGVEHGILTVYAEVVIQLRICINIIDTLNTGQEITVFIEAVTVSIDYLPGITAPNITVLIVSRSVVVASTGRGGHPNTGNQLTIGLELIGHVSVELVGSGLSSHRGRIEEVPVVADLLPAAEQLAELGEAIYACLLIEEHAGELGLTLVDTVGTKVVVVAVNLVYAQQLLAVLVVSKAAVLNSPALLDRKSQGVAVVEGCVGAAEPCTGLAVEGGIGIHEGIQTVDLLVLSLLCEGVESVCSEVTLVAEVTLGNDVETVARRLKCAILGSQLDTGEHAEGICVSGIDRSSLVDPVQGQSQRVGLLVEAGLREGEEVVLDHQLAVINDHVVVEVDGCGDLGQNADTLCQLEQEVPSGSIGSISTGQHVDQVVQLSGDRDLGHIDSKDVRCSHLLVDIDSGEGDTVHRGRVGHLAEPCELTVAAGCQAEVEGVLTLLEHVQGDGAVDAGVILPGCGDLNDLRAGDLLANEHVTGDRTVGVVLKRVNDIAIVDRNGLVVVACGNGKHGVGAVNGIHVGLGEVHGLGDNDVHFGRTDDLVAEHHVDLNGTVTLTGEHTVSGDAGEALVGNCPGVTLGKRGLVAGRADTLSGHLNGSTDGGVLVIALDQSMIELSGAGSGGNHHQRGGDGALEAIRRSVDNGELVIAGLSCDVGGRSAAVQIDCLYAACLEHDLSDLLHATAAREGLLTSVKYHEHDLTGLGDTDSGSGSALSVVVLGSGNSDLAVLDQHGTEAADGLDQQILVGLVVLCGSADVGLAVLGDTEEAVLVRAVVGLTVHDQQAAGLTGLHVEAISIHAGDHVVVGDVVGAVGIAVLILGGVSLIQNAGHLPTKGRIVVSIVSVNVDVISGDISGSHVVDHLLTVSRGCIMDSLGDTGGQLSEGAVEYAVVRISGVLDVVACQLAEVICECVANSTSELQQILGTGEISGTLEGCDEAVSQILCVNSVSDLGAGAVGVQSVGHEVSGTVLVVKISSHVVHDDLGQRVDVLALLDTVGNRLQDVHDIVSIHVAVPVLLTEGRIERLVDLNQEAGVGNLLDHLIQSTVDALQSRDLQQVDEVACPTGNVCMVGAELVVVGDIHRAEDVTDISHLAVRQSELLDVLQTGNGNIVAILDLSVEGILGIGYVLSEVRILITGHDTPRAGVVAINAGTDVLDNETCGILCRIQLHVLVSDLLQESEVVDEVGIVVDDSNAECGNDGLLSGGAAQRAALICRVTILGTGRILCGEEDPLVSLGNDLLGNGNGAADGAMLTGGQTGLLAGCLDGRVDDLGVAGSGNNDLCNESLAATAAMGTLGQTGGSTGGSNGGVNHGVVTQSLTQSLAANRAGTGLGTGSTLRQAVTLGRNDLLCSEDLAASAAMAARGQTVGSTSGINSRINDLVVTECRNDLLCNDGLAATVAVAARGQTVGSTGRSNGGVSHSVVTQSCLQLGAAYDTGLSVRAVCTLAQSMAGGRNNVLCNDDLVTYGAMLTGSQTGLGTGRSNGLIHNLGMTGCSDLLNRSITAAANDLLGAGLGTGCICNHIAAARGVVGDIPTVLNRAGQRNLNVAGILNELVGYLLSTVGDLNGTGTGNISTACGGVDITLGCINGTIDHDLGVYQVSLGSGVGSAGGIAYSQELIVSRAYVITPLVGIVHVHVDTGAQGTIGSLTDDDLRAGEECNVLIDGNVTLNSLNRHVVLDTQIIVLGVDAGGTDGHVDGGYGDVAVCGEDKSVSALIVILHNVAGGQVEHCAAIGNEGNSRAELGAGHVHGGVCVCLGTGVDGQGNLDVLQIVLRQGEHTVFHIGGLRTAAEVHDLEVLIDVSAVVGNDGTATGNEAVCIQSTAVVDNDGAVLSHLDEADCTRGSTAVGVGGYMHMLGRNADRTVNGDVSALGHGQGTVSGRLGVGICGNRLGGVHSVGGIEGDEQSYAGRNGVVTGSQRSVVHQNESLVGAGGSVCGSRIQALEEIARTYLIVVALAHAEQTNALAHLSSSADCEPRSTVVRSEGSRDGHVLGGSQGKGCGGGQDLTGRIGPTQEGVAALGSCRELNAGRAADSQNFAVGNVSTACSHRAQRAVERNGHVGVLLDRDASEVAHLQRSSRVGQTAVGDQRDGDGCTVLQDRAVRAGGCGSTGDREGVGIAYRKVEGNRRLSTGFVGDGNLVRLLAEQATLGRDGHGAAGNGAGTLIIVDGHLTVQDGNGLGGEECEIVRDQQIVQDLAQAYKGCSRLVLFEEQTLSIREVLLNNHTQIVDRKKGLFLRLRIHVGYGSLKILSAHVLLAEVGIKNICDIRFDLF